MPTAKTVRERKQIVKTAACPTCHALPGEPCANRPAMPLDVPHRARRERYAAQVAVLDEV